MQKSCIFCIILIICGKFELLTFKDSAETYLKYGKILTYFAANFMRFVVANSVLKIG